MDFSDGVSIRATRSPKYSETPLKSKWVREGRMVRVGGGFSRERRGRGDRNPRNSDSSLVSAERQATIASGEMYPECGIFRRPRATRSVADKGSFGNAGNGMRFKLRCCSRGADPPRKESEMTGAISSSDQSIKCVSAGKGSFNTVTTLSNSEIETPKSLIEDTRSLSSSASMMLFEPSASSWEQKRYSSMMIGNSGQISSISLTDLVYVQRSRRSRRRGDANATFRHLRHTCTSVCHLSPP